MGNISCDDVDIWLWIFNPSAATKRDRLVFYARIFLISDLI